MCGVFCVYVCVYACMRVVYICADGDGFEIGDWRGGSLHMYCMGVALESSIQKRPYNVDWMASVPIRPQGGMVPHMIGRCRGVKPQRPLVVIARCA